MLAEHKIRTLTHQLADILASYAESFDAWSRDPSDVSRYERTRANLDLVQVITEKAFPGGRGELGELLLYHGDLKLMVLRHHMARLSGKRAADWEAIGPLRLRHDAIVAALRSVCLARSGLPPPERVPYKAAPSASAFDEQVSAHVAL